MTLHDQPSSEVPDSHPAPVARRNEHTATSRLTGLLALSVFTIVSIWGFSYAIWQRGHDTEPFAEEADIALHLYRGHGFASPMDSSAAAPATAFSPPVYPCVIAGVYRIFGPATVHSRLALLAINALCLGASAAGLVVLGGRLFSPWAGACAGLLLGFHPSIVFFVLNYWDTHLALAIFIWLAVLAEGGIGRAEGTGRAVLLGAGMAVLSLTSASYVLALPFLAWVAVRPCSWRRRLGALAAIGLAFVFVLAPWTIRNYGVFNKVFFVRAGADLELWLGNMPGSHGLTNEQQRHHPYMDQDERRLMLEQGELHYYALCHERFQAEARQHPGAVARRSIRRIVYLLIGDPHEPQPYPLMPNGTWRGVAVGHLATNAVVLALGGAAILLAGRGRRWLIVAALLAVAPYALTHVFDRYSIPLRVGLVLYIGALPWLAWRALTARKPEPTPSSL